ncbi:NAD-dependent epimerase/dehydratase family protein, partial [Candidatus Falkowbacteria bacterium]|nr:NAD-dependent epimerase/dehydratase family protein [Candidatus Falkowbacteria bacterium]
MSKVLVTGGAGFIGSHLVDRLVELGHQVVVVDNLSTGRLSNLNGFAKLYEMNIEDKKLADVFDAERPEIVFHMAAQISVTASFKDIIKDGNANIIASLNVLEQCVKFGVKKIIFSSSAAVYGDNPELPLREDHVPAPASPYAISKLTTEEYIKLFHKQHKLGYTILRYANVYGPRQTADGEAGVISIFIDRLLKGQQPTITGDGNQTRDFVFVQDVVSANVAAMNSDKSGIYNVSTNSQVKINELYSTLRQL